MKTRILLSFIILATFCAWTRATTLVAKGSQKTAATPKPKPAELSTITVNGVADIDPAKGFGAKDAVLVIEFSSDFQCPTCKQLFETTVASVTDACVIRATSCKIYVVHRDFPLPYHAYSRTAANYSRAAAHVGKCEEVEAILFQNQQKWATNGDVKSMVASVLTPREMKKVQALVDAKALEPLPVRATPTMVLRARDGKSYPIAGMVSYEVLKVLLDQLIRENTSSKSR